MPKDRDQLTPVEPDDADHLGRHRGQGTGGTGLDDVGAAEDPDDASPPDPDEPGGEAGS